MILIKMDMPENCNTCPFHDWEYYVCLAPGNGNQDVDVMNYNTTRHPKCPLMGFKEYMQDPVTKILHEYREQAIINSNLAEYEKKNPTPFYVVEHEGQRNPITKSFESAKEAETYFNKNLGASPILYEVTPIEWVDKNGTKHETYN